MGNFVQLGGIDVTALCDIYPSQMDRAKQTAPNAKQYSDHRKVLDDKNVDIVLIAVPDHWHTTIAIDALNSGRDVYCEKPLTLRIEEGPAIVKAARLNNRICQVGMQQRSGKHYLQAKEEYFDTKKLGKITLVRTVWHGNGTHLRRAPESMKTKPENLDWAHFLGPVKWRDWDPQQYMNWRAYLDFGGGQITDLFTHWIDVAHMFLGEEIPKSASAAGGIYQYKDGRTAPDTINVLLEYPGEWTATFDATLAPGAGTINGLEFYGTEGRLWIDRGKFEYYNVPARPNFGAMAPGGRTGAGRGVGSPGGAPAPGGPPATAAGRGGAAGSAGFGGRQQEPTLVVRASGNLDQQHIQNFLDCVKSRKLPNGDVLIGHRSAQASHLGTMAYLQKRRIDFDPVREEVLPF